MGCKMKSCRDLFSDVNTPFVCDGEAIREWMHARFIEKMTQQKRPFALLDGPFEARFEQAVKHIGSLSGLRAARL